MNSRIRIAVAVAALLAAAPAPTASAAPRVQTESGLFNTRYCEILVAKGALPAITVTVWNTIGLNSCPPAQWKRYDAGALATQLGAALVVLNGPRYWVFDRASDTRVGAVRSFGALKLRDVARIRITTAADLARKPYETRVVDRTNRWTWKPGRTLYQLVSPAGTVYTMQAYSQIVDPKLRLSDLTSLGSRLKLPAGWRYRTRVARRGFVLQATGRATIVQDELQNTYQRTG